MTFSTLGSIRDLVLAFGHHRTPVFFSFVVLLLLTALAAIAALAISLRGRLSGRTEQLVASTIVWNVLILVPVYALGWANRLTAWNLAGASAFLSLSALTLAARGRTPKTFARELGRAVWGLVRLPIDGLVLAARPASIVVVAAFGALGLILWSAVSAYVAHTLRMWDCFWYHEPIVAFVIQNGFAIVSLPESLQRINSLPRVGEMTALWFVIFTDRRLIDVTNSLLSPALLATEYLLCVQFAKSRVLALGWACAFFLMPTILWELGSTLTWRSRRSSLATA